MLSLSKNNQIMVGILLVALLITTRGHHFASISHLPSASWAVFFLAGVYLRPVWMLPVLFAVAGGLDVAAVTWGGVDNFCVSPAYPFLIPAYASLWLAGRIFAANYRFTWTSLLSLAASVLTGSVLAHLFSSGGFYYFSGKYAEPTLVEFGQRSAKYFPSSLGTLLFYVGVALLVHVVFKLVSQNAKLTSA